MSSSINPFKRVRARREEIKDIESIFNGIRDRDPEIRDLYVHQADVLREYENQFLLVPNVGLELPTGSGKTLVGLLIGEFKRRKDNQRILYLCPTRQLAYQAGSLSKKYGINTRVFVGKKAAYDSTDLTLYRTAKTIAITTYSALFNVNPEFSHPNTIILDDAHTAETYISSMWTLNIRKLKYGNIYSRILSLFEDDLPPHYVGVIKSERRELMTHRVEKIPFGAFYRKLASLRETLNEILVREFAELYYPWSMIRDGLHACHVYISYDNILIRPFIPPALNHRPFSDADQRIFMSATLGHGGEIERITGVGSINRITTPKAYETRGIGRRFFIFPDFTFDQSNYDKWIAEQIQKRDKTLVLNPSWPRTRQFIRFMNNALPGIPVLTSNDVEESSKPFIESPKSVLALANRYDGIDLPLGVCRQVIINGIPRGTNIQESFFAERIGLELLFRERVKTRIQQAAGRCTRSFRDYAAIIMADPRLLEFCAKAENQDLFHPEIRVEMKYSIELPPESQEVLDAMLSSFFAQDEHWAGAEEDIDALRSQESVSEDEISKILKNVVNDEVNFTYAIWNGDYKSALDIGGKITDALSGSIIAPYRALWYYFSANPALLLSEQDPRYIDVADELMTRAKQACKTVSWFPHALKSIHSDSKFIEDISNIQAQSVENILGVLSRYGYFGKRFNEKMDEIKNNLESASTNEYEAGLTDLGRFLGFDSFRPLEPASPDSVWYLEDNVTLLFEAKSDEDENMGVTVTNCRQTMSYTEWAKSNDVINNIEKIHCILVTPKTSVNRDATQYGNNVSWVHTSIILDLYQRCRAMLFDCRQILRVDKNENPRDIVLHNLMRNKLTPEDVITLFLEKKVSELDISTNS